MKNQESSNLVHMMLFTVATVLLVSSCGGSTSSAIAPPWLPPSCYFYIADVELPEMITEGQPLELQLTVNLPDGDAWTSRTEQDLARKMVAVSVDVDSLDEAADLYRVELGPIRIPWPGRQWDVSDLNQPPFIELQWDFPGDLQVHGSYVDGRDFEGSLLLPVGTYELYIWSGDPPVGSVDIHDWGQLNYVHFGSFEVVPAGSGA